jgi:hypothetical protein
MALIEVSVFSVQVSVTLFLFPDPPPAENLTSEPSTLTPDTENTETLCLEFGILKTNQSTKRYGLHFLHVSATMFGEGS